MLIQQLFIQNYISYEETEQRPTCPHNRTEDSGIYDSVLSLSVCHQYRILDFVNQTTVRQLLALPHQFGTCDHQDASSVGQKDEKYLALSQGCTVDVQDTPIQISATRLPLLGSVGSSAFKLKDTH